MKVAELFAELKLEFDAAGFDKANTVLKSLLKDATEVGEAVRKMFAKDAAGTGQLLDKIKAQREGAAKALDTIGLVAVKAKDAEKPAGLLAGALGRVGFALGGLFAVSSIKGAFIDMASGASALTDSATRLGVSVETLQKFGYAAETSGASMQSLEGALGKLNLNLAAPSDAFRKSLRGLGISSTDAAVKSKDLTALLPQIADGLAKVQSPAQRASLAVGVLGKQGVELLPMLADGSAGLTKATAELESLGGLSSAEAVARNKRLGDQIGRVQKAFAVLYKSLLKTALPAVEALAAGLLMAAKGMARLGATVQRHGKLIALLLGSVAIAFGIVKLQAYLASSGVTIFSLATVKAGWASVRAAVMSAAAWLAAAAPFIALVAGIAVVIAILQDLYVWFKGGDSVLKDLYYSARYWLTEKIGEAIDWLSDKFSKIGEALTSGFKIAIDWIDEKIKWIQTKIVESYRDMQELLGLGPKAGEGWENTAGQDRAEEKRRQARAEETARKMDAFRQKAVFAANAPMAAPTTGPLSAGLGPTVEAPMSITITGAGDPQATAQAVGAEVRKHLDATARKIQAGARK